MKYPYSNDYARLYDIFYSDKAYDSEAGFVHKCLRQFGTGKADKILELACGSGNHAFELEKFGYEIIASDYSEGMLAQARKKAVAMQSRVVFSSQDMRRIDLPDDCFDAVICLFDSIGYANSNEEIHNVLSGVCRHLKDDGLFIFEFWHAAAMLSHYESLRLNRKNISENRLLRISETSIDYFKQIANVKYTIFEFFENGGYTEYEEVHVNRFFSVPEMDSLLKQNKLTPVKWFAGFSDDEAINDGTWHILCVARRV